MTLRYLRENVEFAVGQVRDGDSNYCQNGYLYSHTCLCSVLGHWRGICLLVNPHVLCSVLGHWRGICLLGAICLLVNPHFLCSVLGHWRGICLLVNPHVLCSVLGHWRGICLLVNPHFCVLSWVTGVAFVCSYLFARKPAFFVFCLGSLAWHLFARKPTCFVFCLGSLAWHLFARKPTCFVFLLVCPCLPSDCFSLLTSINMSAANILDVLMSP